MDLCSAAKTAAAPQTPAHQAPNNMLMQWQAHCVEDTVVKLQQIERVLAMPLSRSLAATA
jgi:hypothetical protein